MAEERLTRNMNTFELPEKYEFVRVLGQGGFGKVLRCLKKDTKEVVAVKIPKHRTAADTRECLMLQHLMRNDFDKYNIVKFYESFDVTNGKALVFESLDMNLDDYIRRHHPISLGKIRVIIKQLATAFEALKGIGLIHTDVKPDNIMVVNRWTPPFTVKLIDFGLALNSSETRAGMRIQTVYFRAPEILLGLPFAEPVDMWALGGVLATMILGDYLFPARDDYEALRFITDLLGQPSDDLLRNGTKTSCYFGKTDMDHWRLMTPMEYWGETNQPHINRRRRTFPSLDYLKQIRQEDDVNEASERDKCTELLKDMLRINAAERITPSQVLRHPFVSRGYYNSCNEGPEAAAESSQTQTTSKAPTETVEDESSTSGSLSPSSYQQPPSPVQPQPAAATGSLEVDGDVTEDSQEISISLVTSSSDPPVLAPKDDVNNIHPDHHSRSSEIIHTVVIKVRPATAENTVTWESQESDISSLSGVSESSLGLSDSDASWTSEDSTTSDDSRTSKEEDGEEEVEEEVDEEEEQQQEQKKKKRKNCFRRFFSWMKRNLCCCWTCEEEDD